MSCSQSPSNLQKDQADLIREITFNANEILEDLSTSVNDHEEISETDDDLKKVLQECLSLSFYRKEQENSIKK